MELWEFNAFMQGCEVRRKTDTANCILTGYYGAYYANGGRKAKSPDELIRRLFQKKQSFEEGLREIQRIKNLERGGN